jgi:predicted SAM-dependent methyltransferase
VCFQGRRRHEYGVDVLSGLRARRAPVANGLKYLLTWAVMPSQRRHARRLQATTPLRLHLGSAANRLSGWVNVDLLRPGRTLELYWDLRRPLPFRDSSVDAVFAEHLLEHLSFPAGVALLRECRRVLRLDGIVRVGVPDLDRYVASYLGNDDIIERVRPGRPTRALALGEPFFLDGHKCMYDFETMRLALITAGFTQVERRAFGQGRLQPSPDSAERRDETMYVEAWNGRQ